MTSRAPDSVTAPEHRGRARLELSATQLIATALAAITATVAASYLGVSGTVIGAAVASVVSAIGNAVYSHSLRRTRDRMRGTVGAGRGLPARPGQALRPGGRAGPPLPYRAQDSVIAGRMPVLPAPVPAGSAPRQRSVWRRIAFGSVALFAALLAVVTGVEVVSGRPLSDLVRGSSGSGTSLFGSRQVAAGKARRAPHSAPIVTRTVTPSVVVTTPTVTHTATAVTRTATPSASPSSSAGTPAPTSGAAQGGSQSPVG
jgi:hypothetical protein